MIDLKKRIKDNKSLKKTNPISFFKKIVGLEKIKPYSTEEVRRRKKLIIWFNKNFQNELKKIFSIEWSQIGESWSFRRSDVNITQIKPKTKKNKKNGQLSLF